MAQVLTAGEVKAMRESGKMLATVLRLIEREVKAGMTPKDVSAAGCERRAEATWR